MVSTEIFMQFNQIIQGWSNAERADIEDTPCLLSKHVPLTEWII